MNKKYYVLDTETTGLSDDSEILEISIIDNNDLVILDTRVEPSFRCLCEEWPEAQKIHGITVEDVEGMYPLERYKNLIFDIFRNYPVYIYNSAFDTRMLIQSLNVRTPEYASEFIKIIMHDKPNNLHCVMEKYKNYSGYDRWQSLTNACLQSDIDISDLKMHSSLSDCIATNRLIKKCGFV